MSARYTHLSKEHLANSMKALKPEEVKENEAENGLRWLSKASPAIGSD